MNYNTIAGGSLRLRLQALHYLLPLLTIISFGLAGCRPSESQPLELPDTSRVAHGLTPNPLEPPAPTPPPIRGLAYLSNIKGIALDIRYTTTNNITGDDLYGEYAGCYLHPTAANKLAKAQEILSRRRPGVQIVVLDALRPVEAQEVLWKLVAGTKHARYVADPDDGSVHSYGFAVDVTLRDPSGELDMGTAYDDFTPLAQPRNEALYRRNGQLSKQQLDNRLLLRSVMREAGFLPLKQEWWHFNALGSKTVKARYKPYSTKDLTPTPPLAEQ